MTIAWLIDLTFREPSNRFHPVAWIGNYLKLVGIFIRRKNPSGAGADKVIVRLPSTMTLSAPASLKDVDTKVIFEKLATSKKLGGVTIPRTQEAERKSTLC